MVLKRSKPVFQLVLNVMLALCNGTGKPTIKLVVDLKFGVNVQTSLSRMDLFLIPKGQ